MEKYYSIEEAAEFLTSNIKEKIRPRDILELARTGKIRVCVPFRGRIELCIYEPGSYPALEPMITNKLFNGYIQIPTPSIRLDNKEFGLGYAEIYKSLDAGSNEDRWLKPTEKAPRIAARRIKNFDEKTNEIEYGFFHVSPKDFEIPEQDLLEHGKFQQPRKTTEKGKTDWVKNALEIADRIANKRYKSGIREITIRNICDAVATELAKDPGNHGSRGQRSSGNVRNVALKGWKFTPPTGTSGTNE